MTLWYHLRIYTKLTRAIITRERVMKGLPSRGEDAVGCAKLALVAVQRSRRALQNGPGRVEGRDLVVEMVQPRSWAPREHERDHHPREIGDRVLEEPDERRAPRGEDEGVHERPVARQPAAGLRIRLLDERQHGSHARRRTDGGQDPAVLVIALLSGLDRGPDL